ncbi:hypothetical protein [Chamaesiphon sp. VAR_48_metabat_135_sub]|uniref:hypothetical protein n=1 Tax=Chamaesiphon sp. VAR_48_metabat_135_sub TaxID=2964699 RepID=UPI00286A4DB4|nr:hypothetical protein [Chamaesiphon sp. VAR_48_metabat_135_sub]
MQLTFNFSTIILISLLTSVISIDRSARAEDKLTPNGQNGILIVSTQLECNANKIKEVTQVPVIKNNTSQTISSGQIIYWQASGTGKGSGTKQSITLNQPLAPGQTINTGVNLSGDNNSCKAYY